VSIDPDYLVRLLAQMQYGHLEFRVCRPDAPMAMEQKDDFRWYHPDAVEVGEIVVANRLIVCHCPHCDFRFTCLPRPQ
jgi:hypothetical protein